MNLNTNKLFYVRNLQKKIYFPNDEFVSALFMLEKFLFDNYSFTEEVPLKILKQKWIYESIEKDDYANDITKNFKVFEELDIKQKVLNLIECFSAIPNIKNIEAFLKNFQSFNEKFNLLISRKKSPKSSSLKTSILFQFVLLTYIKKFPINLITNEKYFRADVNHDLFETVFIEIFKKKNIFRISKSYYLFKLILKLIRG